MEGVNKPLRVPYLAPLPIPDPSPPLVGLLNPARGSGERCKLSQWGLWQQDRSQL